MSGKRSREAIYNQIMNAALRADDQRRDLAQRPDEKKAGKFAADEAEWLIYMREALISFSQFITEHGDNQDVRNLADMTIGPMTKYLEHRMQSKGVVRRYRELRDRFARDGGRHALVKEIEALGYSKTAACAQAAELLAEHPIGQTEKGEPVDAGAILRSVKRWEKTGLPDELWRLPGQEKLPPLPDPKQHGKPRR